MPKRLKLAVAQSRTLSTLQETLAALAETTRQAASQDADLILFPEAYLGGYPRTCSFGSTIGSRTDEGREQFFQYFQQCVDLGDTPLGAGDDWIERKLPVAKGEEFRGDGTREYLEKVARETDVFVVTGLVEKSGGTLYCAVVYVCPRLGVLGKRRKVMPTGSERLVWGQGSPSTLRAVTTTIKGVKLTMAAAICWENLMPQLRWALYSQNVNLWLAPTADARDTWLPLIRTIGNEGRCFVLSSIACTKRKHLPSWVTNASTTSTTRPAPPPTQTNGTPSPQRTRRRSTFTIQGERHEVVLPAMSEDSSSPAIESPTPTTTNPLSESTKDKDTADDNNNNNVEEDNEFMCRGGSCICGPRGQVLAEPLWEVDEGGLLLQECDFEDCERGRLDLDLAGSYSRNDAFKLTVAGLDLNPPP